MKTRDEKIEILRDVLAGRARLRELDSLNKIQRVIFYESRSGEYFSELTLVFGNRCPKITELMADPPTWGSAVSIRRERFEELKQFWQDTPESEQLNYEDERTIWYGVDCTIRRLAQIYPGLAVQIEEYENGQRST